jgi:hypothetical protein
MEEEALKLASHVTHPVTVAVFALIFAAFALRTALKSKKPLLAMTLSIAIVVLGLAPLMASSVLQSRGVYRVRIIVLGLDGQPVRDADVTSVGGEIKKGDASWELEISPPTRPADGKVPLFASIKNAFLAGSSTQVLADDYYPTVTIQLAPLPQIIFRGMVKDGFGRSVAGARVSILGYNDVATTNEMGNFELPAHAAEGQIVSVHAEKGDLATDLSVPAGRPAVLLLAKR